MPSPSRSMARRSWAMCWPKSRVVVLIVLRSCVGVPLIVYGRITRQREKNHRKSDIKSDGVPCSAMCACQMCGFLRFFLRARQSTCKFAWHQSVILPPLVLRRMGGQIRRFSPSANLSHKWLVICRNYCVEFSLFISAPYTRAHHWDFALFAFTTFTERDPKNVGVFLKNVQRFSFFLRRFLKNVGRFYELLPTFLKVAAVCRQTGCLESHFFLFSVEKKPLFSTRVWRLWKQKNANPRERARVSRAREKNVFSRAKYDAHHECLIEKKFPRFLHPLLLHFSSQMGR